MAVKHEAAFILGMFLVFVEARTPYLRFPQSINRNPLKQDIFFLPKTLDPIYYDVEMRPNMYQGNPSTFTFDGYVRVSMECRETTTDVIMHALDLDIVQGSIEFGSDDGQSNPPRYVSHVLDAENQLLSIKLTKNMAVNRKYFVKMNFTGPLKDDLRGFYLSTYDREGTTVNMATTQFESTDARKAFPCFDEPEMKAHFNMTLVRPAEGYISMSNMKIASTEPRDAGFVADIYETSPEMSTYLLAFIISDFQFIESTTPRGLEYRVWAQPEKLGELDYSLDVGIRTITFYENYFDIDYPLSKQDMVAIPDFASGAMENWGLITYRAVLLFYVPGETSNTGKKRINNVITHELAHQWFGNLVTMEWWSDLWLNEGFATFFSYVGTEEVEPGWDMYNQFVIDELFPVLEFDGHVTSHPIIVDVKAPNEIEGIFDAISYNKGGSVLRMLRFFVGEETFKKGIIRYLKSKEYKNAGHNDLFNALKAEAEAEGKTLNIIDIMETWTLQMNYPMVTVTRVGNKRLEIKQERFLLDSASADPGKYVSPFNYTWNIPFTFTTSTEKNFNVTSDDVLWILRNDTDDEYTTTVTIPSPDDGGWILGNLQHHGFYRVNYDQANWLNIIKQLDTDHQVITPINRAQIINDAMDLSRVERLDQTLALNTLEYLKSELHYYPWTTARSKLVYLDRMLRNTEVYPLFQTFLRESSAAAFQQYGLTTEPSVQIDSFAQRVVAGVACDNFNQDCMNEARDIFVKWRQDSTANKILPELRLTVLCTGIAEGVADDWFYLYDRYQEEDSLAIKGDMMRALTCSQEPDIIRTLLERAIQPNEIPRQDANSLIAAFPSLNPSSQPLVWQFIKDKYDILLAEYNAGIGSFGNMIIAATTTFNTQADLDDIEDFMLTHPNLGVGAAAFERAVSQTKTNMVWMAQNFPIVRDWLERPRT